MREWSEYEKQKLIELRALGRSWREIVEEFKKDPRCRNKSREALRSYWRFHCAPKSKGEPNMQKDSDLDNALKLLIKHKNLSVIDFANALDVSPRRALAIANALKEQGKEVTIEGDRIIFSPPKENFANLEFDHPDHILFGAIGDTHLGSVHQQISALKEFYAELQRRGVRYCLHVGDWVEGSKIYKGQEYELFLHTFSEQLEYLKSAYPKIDGITTIGISGNHDESWTTLTGWKIIKEAAKDREDIVFLGSYQGTVSLGNFRIFLYHPDGGQAYAISYKLQKLIESFTAENLPDIVLMGHFHQKEYVTIRNVENFQTGCFQTQTPYQIRRNLHPVIGGWIIEAEKTKTKTRIKAEFIRFDPVEEDFPQLASISR